ncbi:MAG: shikimate dehydrogenase [Deltaproteobacteria bacterium]|nr:MAG: shikimate dehydrogenase [Deltaproteobacteria bacterium]
MDRYFIIGDPVAHSISPCIHGELFSRYGIRASYEPVRVRRGDVKAFLAFSRERYRGGNVTIPHKEEAARCVDHLDEGATFSGAVNTVVLREGDLWGYNTDGPGFVLSVREEVGHFLYKDVVIFGGGGAVRGILPSLAGEGVGKVPLVVRSPEKVRGLINVFSEKFKDVHIGVEEWGSVEATSAVASADLVVNATSLGLEEEFLDFPSEEVKKGALVVDIVYRKGGTRIARECERKGIDFLDGLAMLAGQALYAFEIWTGVRPDYPLVREIARACLSKK